MQDSRLMRGGGSERTQQRTQAGAWPEGRPSAHGVTLGLPRPRSSYCPRAGKQSVIGTQNPLAKGRVGRCPRGPGLMKREGSQRLWGPTAPCPGPMVSAGRSPPAVPSLPPAGWEQHPRPGTYRSAALTHEHTTSPRLTEARRARLRAGRGSGVGGQRGRASPHLRGPGATHTAASQEGRLGGSHPGDPWGYEPPSAGKSRP